MKISQIVDPINPFMKESEIKRKMKITLKILHKK